MLQSGWDNSAACSGCLKPFLLNKQTRICCACGYGQQGFHWGNSINNNNGLAGVTVAATSPGISSAENNSLSPVPYVLNRGRSNTCLEKVTERRQRRMIKNRESAARSRARKQAATNLAKLLGSAERVLSRPHCSCRYCRLCKKPFPCVSDSV